MDVIEIIKEKLETNTIDQYFKKIYKDVDLVAEFYKILGSKLLSYKYPLEICLSSTYEGDGTLLGTLTFLELDINGYPTYTGGVVDKFDTTYETTLNFKSNIWTFTLSTKDTEITINSITTNSLNPTKVDYEGISRPTSGACKTKIPGAK